MKHRRSDNGNARARSPANTRSLSSRTCPVISYGLRRVAHITRRGFNTIVSDASWHVTGDTRHCNLIGTHTGWTEMQSERVYRHAWHNRSGMPVSEDLREVLASPRCKSALETLKLEFARSRWNCAALVACRIRRIKRVTAEWGGYALSREEEKKATEIGTVGSFSGRSCTRLEYGLLQFNSPETLESCVITSKDCDTEIGRTR